MAMKLCQHRSDEEHANLPFSLCSGKSLANSSAVASGFPLVAEGEGLLSSCLFILDSFSCMAASWFLSKCVTNCPASAAASGCCSLFLQHLQKKKQPQRPTTKMMMAMTMKRLTPACSTASVVGASSDSSFGGGGAVLGVWSGISYSCL